MTTYGATKRSCSRSPRLVRGAARHRRHRDGALPRAGRGRVLYRRRRRRGAQPSSAEITAAECARFAIDAAERGRVVAIPGFSTKFLAWASRPGPRSLVRRVAGRTTLARLGYKKAELGAALVDRASGDARRHRLGRRRAAGTGA